MSEVKSSLSILQYSPTYENSNQIHRQNTTNDPSKLDLNPSLPLHQDIQEAR